LDYLEKRLKEKPEDKRSYFLLSTFIVNMNDENREILLISSRIPRIFFQQVISFGYDEKKWTEEEIGIISSIISFIMYLSKSSNGILFLKKSCFSFLPYSSFFQDLLSSSISLTSNSSTFMIGLRVIITMINLYGEEEKTIDTSLSGGGNVTARGRKASFLSSHRHVFPLLTDVFDVILNFDHSRDLVKTMLSKGFLYGLQVSILAIAFKHLSFSKENRRILLERSPQRFLSLVSTAIQLFIEEAGECKGKNVGYNFYVKAGGGGRDTVMVENFVEMLLQLSYSFDTAEALQEMFIVPSSSVATSSSSSVVPYDIKKIMEELVFLSEDRGLSNHTKQCAFQLLGRLQIEGNTILPREEETSSSSLTSDSLHHHRSPELNTIGLPSSPSLAASSASIAAGFSLSSKHDILQTAFQIRIDSDADFLTAYECLQEEKSLCPGSFITVLTYLRITELDDLKEADMITILTIVGLLKPRIREPFLKSLKL
jgi:hypothetical protein